MEQLTSYSPRYGHDPAVLAFVKCHVTSFVRWDLLRLLCDGEGRWFDPAELGHLLHKPAGAIQAALDDLEHEGVLEGSHGPQGETAYRMDPNGPSSRVVERLVVGARRSHELRQIIVARVLGGASAAS